MTVNQAQYRAVFFDLDGTLLPMELDEFMNAYFKALGSFVARKGLDPASFSAGLKAGTTAMAENDGARINAEAYWDAFFRFVEGEPAVWQEVLEEFYETEFGAIGKTVTPNPYAARAVETLVRKGYPVVLATMPMFPRRAVEWRLSWAGVDPALFSRLTTFENSTSVKPKPEYCAEVVAACGLRGEDVLMVGNNTVEDMCFTGVGCDAYIITDHLIDPVSLDLSQVKHSTMEEFSAWADSLSPCANPACDIETGPVSAAATAAVLKRDLSASAERQAADLEAAWSSNDEVMKKARDAARDEEGSR